MGNYYDQEAAARTKCALNGNGYSVMHNHSPIILRTEPERIVSLSDFTCGQGRAAACRARCEFAASPADPTPAQQIMIKEAEDLAHEEGGRRGRRRSRGFLL